MECLLCSGYGLGDATIHQYLNLNERSSGYGPLDKSPTDLGTDECTIEGIPTPVSKIPETPLKQAEPVVVGQPVLEEHISPLGDRPKKLDVWSIVL